LFFWCLIFSSLYILDINLLSIEKMTDIFFHFVGCLLILVIVSLDVHKLVNMMHFHLSKLALIS
jgi:hypothetical protein